MVDDEPWLRIGYVVISIEIIQGIHGLLTHLARHIISLVQPGHHCRPPFNCTRWSTGIGVSTMELRGYHAGRSMLTTFIGWWGNFGCKWGTLTNYQQWGYHGVPLVDVPSWLANWLFWGTMKCTSNPHHHGINWLSSSWSSSNHEVPVKKINRSSPWTSDNHYCHAITMHSLDNHISLRGCPRFFWIGVLWFAHGSTLPIMGYDGFSCSNLVSSSWPQLFLTIKPIYHQLVTAFSTDVDSWILCYHALLSKNIEYDGQWFSIIISRHYSASRVCWTLVDPIINKLENKNISKGPRHFVSNRDSAGLLVCWAC